MKVFTFVSVLLAATMTYGQGVNLVGNGEFELYDEPPVQQGQINRAIGWKNLNGFYPGDNDCPVPIFCATPDYFLQGLLTPSMLNYLRVIDPYEGNGYAYFITAGGYFLGGYYEYIHCEMNGHMEIGKSYDVEFQLAHGIVNDSSLCSSYSNNVGILFSTYAPYQQDSERVIAVPQIVVSSVIEHSSWEEYGFSFVADSAYKYVTIGNFYPLSETDTIQVFDCTGSNPVSLDNAGYFIDNVSIVEAGSSSSVSTADGVLEEILQDLGTVTVILNTSPEYTMTKMFDMAGNLVGSIRTERESRISMNVSHLSSGLYVLCIESPNGLFRKKLRIP